MSGTLLRLPYISIKRSKRARWAKIDGAFNKLSPLLGLGIALTLFAVALLASGINSTVTATLAG